MTSSTERTPLEKNSDVSIWVLTDWNPLATDTGSKELRRCCERLGDARKLADQVDGRVGVLCCPSQFNSTENSDSNPQTGSRTDNAPHPSHPRYQTLFHHGADLILSPLPESALFDATTEHQRLANITRAQVTAALLTDHPVQVIFAGGTVTDREWAALLAAKMEFELISPAIWVQKQSQQWTVTHVDATGQRSCQKKFDLSQPIVVTIKEGVAEPMEANANRIGHHQPFSLIELIHQGSDQKAQSSSDSVKGSWIPSELIPVQPDSADIRDVNKLVSGGRGLGSKEGFELLRQVATHLGAGVASSRMAVDQGWIEYERQVGQTGKTVEPDLYIACGISGASHHLDGIAAAKQVIAINCDPTAPIMKRAELGLEGDLYPILQSFCEKLQDRTQLQSHSSATDLRSEKIG